MTSRAGFIFLFILGCKGSGPAAESGSTVASISLGEIPQEVVKYDRSVLTVVENGSQQTYDSKSTNFTTINFKAGAKIRLLLTLFEGDKKKAQTIDAATSKCPAYEDTLAAGNNSARVKVCLADDSGRINATGNPTATTTGRPANIDITPCVVGKNCDQGASGQPQAAAATGLNIKAAITNIAQDKNLYEPARFTVDFANNTTLKLKCVVGISFGTSWQFSTGQRILDLAPGTTTRRFAFNDANEAGEVRDVTMLMDRSIERNEPQVYELSVNDCQNDQGQAIGGSTVVENQSFGSLRRKITYK